MKCVRLGVRNNILKILPPYPVLSPLCPPKCPKNQLFANILRSMRFRGKIVGFENVLPEISYKLGHSKVIA